MIVTNSKQDVEKYLEINNNINRLSVKDKKLLYHFFVLGLSYPTMRFLHQIGHINLKRNMFRIIKMLAK